MKISQFKKIKKYKFQEGDNNSTEKRELVDIARYIGHGLNLEFGVFNGFSISALANARPDLHFHGFDSFEGLPENWDLGQKYVKKEKFDCQGNLPKVPSNVTLYKGWFDKTLPLFINECGANISFLHIDSDLYSSAIYVLDQLNHFINPGTIIRFDELCCWRSVFNESSNAKRVFYTTWEQHEWKALNEWMGKYGRKVVPISRNWFQGATVVVTE